MAKATRKNSDSSLSQSHQTRTKRTSVQHSAMQNVPRGTKRRINVAQPSEALHPHLLPCHCLLTMVVAIGPRKQFYPETEGCAICRSAQSSTNVPCLPSMDRSL